MLHLSTLDKSTYQLLQDISRTEIIQQRFALAGGTALALQIGHRQSIDLDFFSIQPFNVQELEITLSSVTNYHFEYAGNNSRMLFGFINGIKCDFVHDPATLLEPFIRFEDVNYFSIQDIAAMKMHTICGRGKKKDFFDIYALLQLYSWDRLIDWYAKKYDNKQLFFLWRSILYFEDAEDDPDIQGYAPFDKSWEEIKSFIRLTCS